MQTIAFRSYERKIVMALMLLLVVCGFMVFHAFREQRRYTVYVEEGKKVLTGSTSQTFTQVVKYSAPCQEVYDDSLYTDERVVVQEAVLGVKEVTKLTTYYNGDELSSKILDENIITEAVPQVVHIGTTKRPLYIKPMDEYTISSCYGARWGRQHEGIDLATPTGGEVMATAAGTVIRSEYYAGYGNCVDIDHGNGVISRYGHLSKINVSLGQSVSQGEVIALSGNTGNSTGPHLHFELRMNGEAVNPYDYIDF